MSLRIQTNVEAVNAHRRLVDTSARLQRSMERLASGYRINRASDDAAGLAISENLRGQVRGLAQAERNTLDGVSLVQVAEAALVEVHSMLQRVRELAVQYKNGSLSSADQAAIQSEVNQLASEIERIGADSEFNNIKLLAAAGRVTFQVGADDGQAIGISTVSLGQTVGTAPYSLSASGSADISEIDAAISAVSSLRSSFGAVQNRLEHTLASARTYEENLTAAESRIRDADMARELTLLTKWQVLEQAGTAMVAQANQSGRAVLSLLQ